MSYQNIDVDVSDRIAYVTINRPKSLNALNGQTLDELEQFFGQDRPDTTDFGGVILTGAGGRAFVAGADIKEFVDVASQGRGAEMARRGQSIFFTIERFRVPVVAVIDGFALGGGCELAMACHLRIATAAARFGQPEVNLGIIPGYGGTQRLNQYVGKSLATELILTGRMLDAEEAKQSGLVNYVTEDRAAALAKAKELLDSIMSKGPRAIEESIRAINAYYDHASGYEAEIDAFDRTTRTEDFREGASAFVEKRPARFRGK